MPATRPNELSIRTYDVGFGDCFLLTFRYKQGTRSVLIDFGTMSLPERKVPSARYMEHIATQIAQHCGNKLDAVVATHRHQDHISGFSMTAEGKGPGAIIRALKPKLVVQPWTEDPKAQKDATAPSSRSASGKQLHLATLATMQSVAAAIAESAATMHGGDELETSRRRLSAIGMDNIKNESAVRNLQTMAKRHKYVYHGSKSGLETLLPGVKVTVLGPPTVKQTDTILEQRSEDPDEFWHLTSRFWKQISFTTPLNTDRGAVLFKEHASKRLPWSARWYQYYARRERADSLLSIVRILDDAMNNTSIILLFEVGGKLILFPGDAQYENWMYALSKPEVRKKLARVDLYKVGHHGSLNATPRTLWNGFAKRSEGSQAGRLITLLSTKSDVHGHLERKTEVPRRTLVADLKRRSSLLSTQDFAEDEFSREMVIKL